MSKTYTVVEVFHSIQGEGARAGSVNVFLRFAGCNLQCVDAKGLGRPMRGNELDAGFNCDTDFRSGEKLSLEDLVERVKNTDSSPGGCGWVIATGGEPTLQLDVALLRALRAAGYRVALETNGTHKLAGCVDWISCSPKRGTTPAIVHANEIRCVVGAGDEPDALGIAADHFYVSPKFRGVPVEHLDGWRATADDYDYESAAWAIEYCLKNPKWKLSLQLHKILGVR